MRATYSHPHAIKRLLTEHLHESLKHRSSRFSTHHLRDALFQTVTTQEFIYGLVAFENFTPSTALCYEGTYEGLTAAEAIDRFDVPRNRFPDQLLVDLIYRYQVEATCSIVLCDHRLRKPLIRPDWWLSESVALENEVYQVVTREESSADRIESALVDGGDRWMVGICTVADDLNFFSGLSRFRKVVASCDHVFTPALDGMGYVVASRKGVEMLRPEINSVKPPE